MIPTTNPETPKILGTAKVLAGKLITKYGHRESQMISRMLAEHVIGKAYHHFLAYPDLAFSEAEYAQWQEAEIRLLNGEPIQYIIGKAWFYGLELKVSKETLIPRPETEELVELGLELTQDLERPQILDIGTGSGCIAIAFAKKRPAAIVMALDFSASALLVANENSSFHQAGVSFSKVDILEATDGLYSELDLILCNPPYIPQSESGSMEAHVTEHEPASALFVPDDQPLLYYIKVSQLACKWLRAGGWLCFESHAEFGKEVAECMSALGYLDVKVLQDLQARDRMVIGRLP